MRACAHTRARTHPNASRDTMSALESREATVACRVRSLKNCAREKWCRCVCKCMIVCVCAREPACACACAGVCVRVSMFVCVGVRASLCGRAVCLRLSVSIYVSVSLPISLSRPILNRPPPGAASHTHTPVCACARARECVRECARTSERAFA